MLLLRQTPHFRVYHLTDDYLLMEHHDQTIVDDIHTLTIKNKGEINNRFSTYWGRITQNIIPNTYVADVKEFDGNIPSEFLNSEAAIKSVVIKYAEPIPVKPVVRLRLCGYAWQNYKEKGWIYDELAKTKKSYFHYDPLDEILYTPCIIKDGKKKYITFEESVDIVGEKIATQLKEKSIQVYERIYLTAIRKGVIIGDTKFEFCYGPEQTILLNHPIATIDSSRYFQHLEDVNPFSKESKIEYFPKRNLYHFTEKWKIPEKITSMEIEKEYNRCISTAQRVTNALYIDCHNLFFPGLT